jgi:hypothetical protein
MTIAKVSYFPEGVYWIKDPDSSWYLYHSDGFFVILT